MIGENNFDFSKPKEQEKFNNLPTDKKNEFIEDAHVEGLKMNKAVDDFEKLSEEQRLYGVRTEKLADPIKTGMGEIIDAEGILGKKPVREQIKSEEKKTETREEMMDKLEKTWKQGIKDREEVEMMHNMREIDFEKINNAVAKLTEEIEKDRLSFIDDEDMKLKVKKLINLKEFIIAESERLKQSA